MDHPFHRQHEPVASGGRRRSRGRTAFSLAVAALLVAPLVALAGSSAASAASRVIPPVTNCPTYASTFGSNVVSVTFHYQSVAQTWIVPSTAVASSICIDASGAQGGQSSAQPGGTGGDVNVVPNVATGQSLQLVVGKRGASGAGGSGAGSGGGGTYVFAPNGSVLAVAGGGGGAGVSGNGGGGGPNPGSTNGNGFAGTDGTVSGSGGSGATTTSAGAAGTGAGTSGGGPTQSISSQANGGSGDPSGGGGGGGGYYGGGGGGVNAGGGGGSNYANPAWSLSAPYYQGQWVNNGNVTIWYQRLDTHQLVAGKWLCPTGVLHPDQLGPQLRLLARCLRRWHLHLRRRGVPRLTGVDQAQRADRGHGIDTSG